MPGRSRATRVPATRRRQPHPLRARRTGAVPPAVLGRFWWIEDLTVSVRTELNRIIDPYQLGPSYQLGPRDGGDLAPAECRLARRPGEHARITWA